MRKATGVALMGFLSHAVRKGQESGNQRLAEESNKVRLLPSDEPDCE
jgi:hypothetical protein